MSDARQSPIPQDRVNENVDQAQRAEDARRQQSEQERYLRDRAEKQGSDTQPPSPAEPDEG